MTPRVARQAVHTIALLVVGSAIPAVAGAHVVGTEVTDPNTPPAVLVFDSAAAHYVARHPTLRPWASRARGAGGDQKQGGGAAKPGRPIER